TQISRSRFLVSSFLCVILERSEESRILLCPGSLVREDSHRCGGSLAPCKSRRPRRRDRRIARRSKGRGRATFAVRARLRFAPRERRDRARDARRPAALRRGCRAFLVAARDRSAWRAYVSDRSSGILP